MNETEQDGNRAPGSAGRVRLLSRLGLIIAAIVAVVAIANVHLVYMALSTQPDCVPHLKVAGGEVGSFRAAKSSC